MTRQLSYGPGSGQQVVGERGCLLFLVMIELNYNVESGFTSHFDT